MPLNAKQQRFVNEYLKDLNATQAAIRAGYSKKTANKSGPRLLVNVGISAAIKAKTNKQAEKAELTVEMIVEGLKKEALREGEGASHSARVSAWGVLAKYKGMATDKVTIGNADGEPFKIDHTIEIRAVYPKNDSKR